MGLLTGSIAKKVFKAFKGKLLTGQIRQETPNTVLDEYGDPTLPTITYEPLEGFVDEYSDFHKANSGIPETDLKVSFFAQSAPTITPAKDDKIQMNGVWYQVRKIKVDPATALWVCQAFVIDPPVDPS